MLARIPRFCAPKRARRWRRRPRAGLIAAADGEALAQAHRLMTAVTQILRLTLPDDAAPEAAAAGSSGASPSPPARRTSIG